jgi:hypothetical protein
MAQVTWSEFRSGILIEVPGVSDPLCESIVRDTAIEFCRRSGAWVHRMDAVPVAAGEATYDWDIPSGSLVVRPLEVWLDGDKLESITSAELSAIYGGDWNTETGKPLYYISEAVDGSLRQVTLAPTPDADITPGMTARLVLKPSRSAADIDEIIFEEHGRIIRNGALARLYLMANKPWSNLKLGDKMEREFLSDCASAGVVAAKANVGAPLRVRVTHGMR